MWRVLTLRDFNANECIVVISHIIKSMACGYHNISGCKINILHLIITIIIKHALHTIPCTNIPLTRPLNSFNISLTISMRFLYTFLPHVEKKRDKRMSV